MNIENQLKYVCSLKFIGKAIYEPFLKGGWCSKFLVAYAFSFWINNMITALHKLQCNKG